MAQIVSTLNILKFKVSSGTAFIMLNFRLDCGVEILFNCGVDNGSGIANKCIVDECSFVNGTGTAPTYVNNKCS